VVKLAGTVCTRTQTREVNTVNISERTKTFQSPFHCFQFQDTEIKASNPHQAIIRSSRFKRLLDENHGLG
jgi:hypothetical protein